MTRLLCRLAASVPAVALIPPAPMTIAAPGIRSAQCDPNWSRNVWTKRMQATTAGAGVMDTPSGICAAIRTGVDTATPSCAAVAAGGRPGVNRWFSAVAIHRALTNRVFR